MEKLEQFEQLKQANERIAKQQAKRDALIVRICKEFDLTYSKFEYEYGIWEMM